MTKLRVGQVVTATLMEPTLDHYYRYIFVKEYLDNAPPYQNQIKVSRNDEWELTSSTATRNLYLKTQNGGVPTWGESIPISYDGTFTPTFTLTEGTPTVTYTYNRFWYMKTIPYSTSLISDDYDVKMFVDFTFVLTDCNTLNNTPGWIQLPTIALAKYTQGCKVSITTTTGSLAKTWDGVISAGESQIRFEYGNGVLLENSDISPYTFNGHFSYTGILV